MPTQTLRDHYLAVHFLIYHLSFFVPALKSTHRYRFTSHIMFSSSITQNVRFGNALHDPCRPRAQHETRAHALIELLRGEIVKKGSEGR